MRFWIIRKRILCACAYRPFLIIIRHVMQDCFLALRNFNLTYKCHEIKASFIQNRGIQRDISEKLGIRPLSVFN